MTCNISIDNSPPSDRESRPGQCPGTPGARARYEGRSPREGKGEETEGRQGNGDRDIDQTRHAP